MGTIVRDICGGVGLRPSQQIDGTLMWQSSMGAHVAKKVNSIFASFKSGLCAAKECLHLRSDHGPLQVLQPGTTGVMLEFASNKV